MGELVHGIIRPETRAALLAIAGRMRTEEKIAGLILGGTELPLILRDVTDAGMPFLDTTQLQRGAAIVERMVWLGVHRFHSARFARSDPAHPATVAQHAACLRMVGAPRRTGCAGRGGSKRSHHGANRSEVRAGNRPGWHDLSLHHRTPWLIQRPDPVVSAERFSGLCPGYWRGSRRGGCRPRPLDWRTGSPPARGLGPRAIDEFVSSVAFPHSQADRIIVGPAATNARSIRAFEKAGFRRVRVVTLPDEPEARGHHAIRDKT